MDEDYYYYQLDSDILSGIKNDSLGVEPGCPSRHYFAPIALLVIASFGVITNSIAIFIILILK